MKHDMTKGSIGNTLVLFTAPLILSGLLQQIFNWVDAFIVGNVEGELALAGIGATTSLYNLFVTVIVGFASGISVFVAQQYGMGEEKQINRILSAMAVVLGGVFLCISFLGVLFTVPILKILDTPYNIFEVAREYMRILFLGIPFLAVYNTYASVLRGMGDSRAAFLSVFVCSLMNAALDILFVAVLHFGVAGAAGATVLAQAVMAVFIVIYAAKKYPLLRFRLSRTCIDWAVIKKGAGLSLPPAVQSGTNSVGNLVLQRFMNGFGEKTVVAITTAYRVDSVILLPIVNFGSGIATVVAQNIGAGNQERAKKVLKTGGLMISAISVCLTGIVLLAGKHLIAMFGLTMESVEIGRMFFERIAACYIVYGLAMAMRGFLEGTGDMLFSGIAGMTALGVRIAASYLLRQECGNMVIAYAEAFSWVALLLIYVFRYFVKNRRKR
ncbi:MATE family efflux transporter [bacterium C-53]|nr:MATE family efflux transporter [Lachnospiraceae bacterium]NBI02569.1 MATE family efflux transporter [Lachnospiraceae bacterium]RKJ11652.1 MATE family efflux transporter [bacterium C-53]